MGLKTPIPPRRPVPCRDRGTSRPRLVAHSSVSFAPRRVSPSRRVSPFDRHPGGVCPHSMPCASLPVANAFADMHGESVAATTPGPYDPTFK